MNIVDGGFNINSEYTPAYIYELAKMDGAIIYLMMPSELFQRIPI